MPLEKLQVQLNESKNQMKKYVDTLKFGKQSFYEDFLTRTDISVPGIYKIEIRASSFTQQKDSWKIDFVKHWDMYKGKGCRTPSSKKIRFQRHNDILAGEWVPLYIGRSLDVRSRLDLHKNTPFKEAYQALKLIDRGIYESENFRVSFFELPKMNYEFISLYVEDAFREQINPIVGIKG
ncbi:hypothetical protein CXF83_08500 [Shewanella sp. Choline-02u-19]|uniref:hypothetical protein n=1 Tax=unclassified Shewanella TaxID=196818 RepID=UPI000C3492E2|nr:MULTISPECIES: hypothetical protein [unclassified Shewanella]PKH62108.1 hypothetical protein CXF84_01430 [Shewanella sp. Bg11-22]PKI26773.1 hypothetical protein CXF83_08500 [Shewanella sp. Choline-02u-19]